MRNLTTDQDNLANGSFVKALRRTMSYHVSEMAGRRVKPLKLRVKLTNRCNARCNMCHVWQMQDNFVRELLPHEIPAEGYRQLCEVNADYLSDLQRIAFTGGEPTLRHDLVEIVRIFHDYIPKAGVSLNSNGFSTRKILDAARQILEFKKKLTIMISLDGIGEAHDRTRGVRNVFPKVVETIDGLRAMKAEGAKIKIEINHVMTKFNVDELPRVHAFCQERGLNFNPIYVIEGELYDNEGVDLTYTDELRERFLGYIHKIMETDNSLQLREVVDMLEGRQRDFDCWAGRIMFILEDDGQLYPNGGCPKSFLLGNVKDFHFDLERLLDSPQARSVLKQAAVCRRCRLSCETMITLRYPEALTGWRRTREGAATAGDT